MITADLDGCFEFEEHGLFEEDLPRLDTQTANLGLGEFGILAAVF